jgi:hypothetical protein
LATCGGLAIRLDCSAKPARPIINRPQIANLPTLVDDERLDQTASRFNLKCGLKLMHAADVGG